MSDDTRNKDEVLEVGGDDDFDADLDAWGDLFDDLHEAEAPGADALLGGAPTAAAGSAAADALGDPLAGDVELDFIGEAQALGSMLGQPEPPPLAEPEAVARPTPAVAVTPAAPALAPELASSRGAPVIAAGPSDEDLFGGLPDEVPADAEAIAALAADPSHGGDEATRIVGPDAALLAETAPAQAASGRAAGEVRRLASADLTKSFSGALAELDEGQVTAEREVAVELDDEFYADIEIGDTAPPAADEAPARRLNVNIARRAPVEEVVEPSGPAVVLEVDDEPEVRGTPEAAVVSGIIREDADDEGDQVFTSGLDFGLGPAGAFAEEPQPEPAESARAAARAAFAALELDEPAGATGAPTSELELDESDRLAMAEPEPALLEASLDLAGLELDESDQLAMAEPEPALLEGSLDLEGLAGIEGLEPVAMAEPPEPTPFVDTAPPAPAAFATPAAVEPTATESLAEAEAAAEAAPLVAVDEPELDTLEPVALHDREAATPFVAPAKVQAEALVLPEVDVAPEFPPSRFAGAEPTLDLAALELPFEAPPNPRAGLEDAAERLASCQRELEHLDEAHALARVHLEAGRLAASLGDHSAAQHHFEAAAEANPRSVLAASGLRRLAGASGDWEAVLAALSAEIELSSAAERRGLAGWRTDLLLATYERERAAEAVTQQLSDAPTDVRALLAAVELAYADDRRDELPGLLARLGAAAGGTPIGEAAQLLRARSLDLAGDDAAVSAYVSVLRADPASRAAIWGLERIALREDRGADAAQAAERVLHGLGDVDPDLAGALARYRGRLAAAAGDNDTYVAALESAAGLCPGDAEVQADLALAYERRGDASAAVRAYVTSARSASSVADQAEAYRRAGRLLAAGAGSALDTVEAVRRVVALDPHDSEAYAALSDALAEAGDLDALLDLDRAAANADPAGGIFERILVAKRLVALNRLDEARRELEVARELAPHSPVVADTLVRVLGLGGLTEQRATLMRELAEADTDFRDPEVSAIRAAHAAEDFAYELLAADSALAAAGPAARDRAVDAWRKVLEFDSSSQAAHAAVLRLAELSGELEAVDRALAGVQTAARHSARAMGIALRRNALLQGAGDAARAHDVLREARAMAPADPRTAMALVALAASAGRWADAGIVLEERAAALGGSPEAQALRFRAAAILHEHTEEAARVVEILAPVVAAYPDFAPAASLLEQAHRRLGDTSLVSADFERKLSGGDDSGRFTLLIREAELFELQVGDPTKAAHLYGKALELRSADPLARDGFERTSAAAGETGPLSQLALDDLKHADEANDAAAKAAAYEELARIDAELRGDPGSARFSYESAAKIDPSRWSVLRALEVAYAAEGRLDDLQRVYDLQIAATSHPADAVQLSVARAWMMFVLKKPARDILGEYKRAYELDQRCGAALLQLESAARPGGPSSALAAFEEAVARYFDTDDRARAAFLTRAGETRLELEDLEGAIACFRAAVDALPGYWPALAGWRRAALLGQLWLDVGESAERHAEYAIADRERVALEHLAGVAFMDRAMSAERAVAALRRALTFDPTHVDAYLRLRMLYEEQGNHDDLAQLLEQRLEVEQDRGHKIEILRALAAIHSDYLGLKERAKEYLRAALAYDKTNVAALTALAQIASEQGEWGEAAGALIQHAKIATDRNVLADIFRQLGRIHSEHVPDLTVAIGSYQKVLSFDGRDEEALDKLSQLCQQSQQWKVALAACERLLQRPERSAESKIEILHRVGEIYARMDEPARAERAYRAALDVDPTSRDALDALVRFYRLGGDLRSLRVHLDTVAGAMRKRLVRVALDDTAYGVLSRVLALRDEAGATGSAAAAMCAAEMAVALGAGDESDARLAARARQPAPDVRGLGSFEIDDALFKREVPNGLRQLLRAVDERLSRATSGDLKRYGVGRGDRIRPGGDAAADVIAQVGAALGVQELEIYVCKQVPTALVAESEGSEVRLIIGAELVANDDAARLRFMAGRALKMAVAGMSVPMRMEPSEFGALLVGLLRSFRPEFSPGGLDMGAVAEQHQRVRKVVSGGMLAELGPYAMECASLDFDHERIWRGIQQTGDRAGLLCAGSVQAAVEASIQLSGLADLRAASADPMVQELMRFSVSEDHVIVRRLLAQAQASG